MPRYTQESLEELKSKVDLVDVLSRYLPLKKAGAAYKACCPFHDERTPSFMIRAGDRHYHCFGCGAHGDAISFLMEYAKLTFQGAIEQLAERYNVVLKAEDDSAEKFEPKAKNRLKEILEKSCRFFQAYLQQSEEAQEPLEYLISRGMSLAFITSFRVGYAPKAELLRNWLRKEGYNDEELLSAGMLNKTQSGALRDFFSERITFPILDPSGSVIGFSARKWKESTFGGKYINTSETALFKKSKILFGMAYSRRRLAKEKCALIVEGQIDALRLIENGLDCTVAGLGTAFGEAHAKELHQLGVTTAYLLFDGDPAGKAATHKVGHILQKEGIEPFVALLPDGEDPDSLVRKHGIRAVLQILSKARDFIRFLIDESKQQSGWKTPAEKMREIHDIVKKVREWGDEILIHESLHRIADLSQVPKSSLGLHEISPRMAWRQSSAQKDSIRTSQHVLEEDLVRWLLVDAQRDSYLVELCKLNIIESDFRSQELKVLYSMIMEMLEKTKGIDLLELSQKASFDEISLLIDGLLTRRVNRDKSREHLAETLYKLKERSLFEEREELRQIITAGNVSDEEAIVTAKRFDELKNKKIEIRKPESDSVL